MFGGAKTGRIKKSGGDFYWCGGDYLVLKLMIVPVTSYVQIYLHPSLKSLLLIVKHLLKCFTYIARASIFCTRLLALSEKIKEKLKTVHNNCKSAVIDIGIRILLLVYHQYSHLVQF